MDEPEALDGVILRQPMHPALRVGFVAIGLFCIGVTTLELGRALWPPSVLSLFFGAIVFGAWTVGGQFVLGGLAGRAQVWSFTREALTVTSSNVFGTQSERFGPGDVTGTEIRTIDWDSGPGSFAVVLHLRDGRRLETADYRDRRGAEIMQHRLARHFRLKA